jgi:Xaa-Pro aminopeptidase
MRIENLVVVVRDASVSRCDQTFLRFDTLTLCPIDRRLIDASRLCEEERRWLNEYHAAVARALGPFMDGEDARWLEQATEPLDGP